jgi:hypothetical protein
MRYSFPNSSTKEEICRAVVKSDGITPIKLRKLFPISRVMIHRYLKQLVNENRISKHRSSPKSWYGIRSGKEEPSGAAKAAEKAAETEVAYLEFKRTHPINTKVLFQMEQEKQLLRDICKENGFDLGKLNEKNWARFR